VPTYLIIGYGRYIYVWYNLYTTYYFHFPRTILNFFSQNNSKIPATFDDIYYIKKNIWISNKPFIKKPNSSSKYYFIVTINNKNKNLINFYWTKAATTTFPSITNEFPRVEHWHVCQVNTADYKTFLCLWYIFFYNGI